MRLFTISLLFPFLTASVVAANDDALYDPLPDPDASFIRVISPSDKEASIGGADLTLSDGATAYFAVGPGSHEVLVRGQSVQVTVENRDRFTVAVGADGAVHVLEDLVRANPSQAGIAAYNMASTPSPVSLYVPAASTDALSEIAAGTGKSVSVRAPLTLDFEFRAGEETLATLSEVALRRDEGVSLILVGTAGNYEALVVPHLFGTGS